MNISDYDLILLSTEEVLEKYPHITPCELKEMKASRFEDVMNNLKLTTKTFLTKFNNEDSKKPKSYNYRYEEGKWVSTRDKSNTKETRKSGE